MLLLNLCRGMCNEGRYQRQNLLCISCSHSHNLFQQDVKRDLAGADPALCGWKCRSDLERLSLEAVTSYYSDVMFGIGLMVQTVV